MVGAERFELPTLCSQINFPDNKLLLFNRLASPKCPEMYQNVQSCTQRWGALLRALLVIVRRGRLPVRVIVMVSEIDASCIDIHIDELNA